MSKAQERLEIGRFREIAPAAAAAIQALSQSAVEAGLAKELLELVKLRASQMNGCAYCVQYHLTEGRRLGIPRAKLDLAIVWHEVDAFSDRERAALAWTEALTRLGPHGVANDVYASAREQFSETELAFLTAAIGAINVWNRFGTAFRFKPVVPREAQQASAA